MWGGHRVETTRERETQAGRLGGAAGSRIVWDEAAVDALLDRWEPMRPADGAGWCPCIERC